MRSVLLGLVLVLGLVSSACAPASEAPAAEPASAPAAASPAPLRTVRIASPGSSLSYLPAKVADERGFFRAEGLELEWLQLAGELSVTAILAGDLDYTTVPSSAAAAAAQGAPMKIVSFMSVKLQHQLVSRPEITTMAELAGKRIGVQRQGDLTAFETRRVVDHFGLPDVTIVSVGRDTERLAALQSGAVDAVVLAVPWDVKAERLGMRTLLAIGSVLEIPQAGLATSEEKLRRDPDELAGLIRGIIRGTQYLSDPAHRDDIVAIIADWIELTPEEASQAFDRVRDTYSPNALPTDAQLQSYLAMLRATGAATESTTAEQLTDFRITRRVAAEMGVAP